MLGELFNNPFAFFSWLMALIVAITIHEFSHALAADRLGDPTPRVQGRLTLNPLAHLDPLGTLMIIIAQFGWGKPVIFDPFNLRHPRRDTAIISLAGPISNILLAMLLSFFIGLLDYWIIGLLRPIIVMNVVLALFNLVPIHPLDGFKIVWGALPPEQAQKWQKLEPYGMIILLFCIFPIFGSTSLISQFITPIIQFLLSILLPGKGSSGII